VIYVCAKNRRQFLAWCNINETSPHEARFVESLADVRDFDPTTDRAVHLGTQYGLDATERREILTTLGITADPLEAHP
jgi:hypothetical protein